MANAPIPAVSVALRDDNRFLLVKRGRAPNMGFWAFAGGRVEAGETLEAAVQRELLEETGLVAADYRMIRMIQLVGESYAYDLHIFSAVATSGQEPVAGDDAADVGWFNVDDMAGIQVTPSTVEIAQEILGRAFKRPCWPRRIIAMIRRTLPASLLTIAILASAPVRAAEAPFEPSLLRLSEVLGSLHYLSALCGKDGPQWRGLMEKLVAAEAPDEARKARFIASFNRGYRSFASVYTTCTASAQAASQRYQAEGKELASQTAARFGN